MYDCLEQLEDSLIPDLDMLPIPNKSEYSKSSDFQNTLTFYIQNSKYYRVLLGKNGNPSFYYKLKDCLKQNLKNLFANKVINDETELDYVLEYNVNAMLGVLNHWLQNEQNISSEDLVNLIERIGANCGDKWIVR